MDRGQYARAHQERTQQTQGKRNQRQHDGPASEQAALFCDCQRVDQRRANQPGQKRGIFNRVPKPPAAPAQLVISPPGTHGNTNGQANPGRCSPGTRPARPGRIQPAIEQCSDGEGKRHRHADITHVKHRRVKHQPGILQQRVEVTAILRNIAQAQKRAGSQQHEQQKPDRDQGHDTQYARQHHIRELA
ncbi:hypothetical protein GALL_494760 [mine drainage metagenome]|uniref:Uncharacterized protein n=1 Tax=mine drainage metagenome TaxID=410659 RepID=A0A1J5PMV5_9ZZZZ